MKTNPIVIGLLVGVSLIFYFVASFTFLPTYYQSLELPKPIPRVSEVIVSDPSILLGESFKVKILATNTGDTSDFQLVTIAFPNVTSFDNIIKITTYDFLQSPFFVEQGEEVGSEYSGPARTVIAPYPSIEAYSRPWKTGEDYRIDLNIVPQQTGKFVFYVKTVSFPHTHELAHYPHEGLLDYQNEFVDVYTVLVNP